MSDITVEVVPDTERPQGGHAIIRLNGLWLLPANATFRLEPVDTLEGEPMPWGWPRGDLTPVETRLTPLGVEIVAGPEVVDAPPLLPGTPVAIAVPAAFVKSEVLWPDLPVSAMPEPPPVMLTAAELAAELDAAARLSRDEAALTAADAVPYLADAGAGHSAAGLAPAATLLDPASRELSELRPRNAPSAPADVARDAPPLPTIADAAIPAAVVPPAPPTDLVPVRPAAVASRREPRRAASFLLPFAAGFVVAAALTALVAYRQGGARAPVSAAADGAAQVTTLADAATLGLVSPRGRQAGDVDLATALQLADESLAGDTRNRDEAEAGFWLRKALSLSVASPQLTWAMTQLGTLYARPANGTPDYGKARLLWEMAGAGGDATALCFLGALHENGLGVAKSREKALAIYERAKSLGGCRNVDAAIARVRS